MQKSRLLLYCGLCFILGISWACFFSFWDGFFVLGLLLGLFLVLITGRYQALIVLLCCGLFFMLGVLRYRAVRNNLESSVQAELAGEKITLLGTVVGEPEQGLDKTQFKFQPQNWDTKILVTTGSFGDYHFQDFLRIKGELKIPTQFEGFNYREYLKKEKVNWVMYYPEIKLIGQNPSFSLKKTLIGFKNKLSGSIKERVSFPASALFEALLFGEESSLPQSLKQKLNITGTRHIAAVSGANITIICNLLMWVWLGLGLWRQQAFYLSLVTIVIYVLMIGAPISGIRAAIMGGLVLTAQFVGRPVRTQRLAVLAGALMLAFNPLLLKLDIGFQLSFLAVLGLIYLQPFFSKILSFVPKALELRTSLSSTLAAQIFVLPLLLYNFGRFSLVSPLTNVLILPAIPYLTMAGFGFAFLGLIWGPLGQIVAWPAQLGLGLVMKVIDFFAALPGVSQTLDINIWFLLLFYLILIGAVVKIKHEENKLP